MRIRLTWCQVRARAVGLSCAQILLAGGICSGQIPQGDIKIKLDTLVSYNPPTSTEVSPVDLIPLDDGTGRMILSSLAGTIRVLSPTGHGEFELLSDPLLSRSQTGGSFIGETGTTGIAIHPDFSSIGSYGYGKFYTITSEPQNSGTADFPTSGNNSHQAVVREWDVSPIVGDAGVNSLSAVATSDSREILRMDRSGNFHGMFDLAFDDDHLLYITSGDGGIQYDPNLRAQNLSNLYGTVIRIDPDPTAHSLVRTSANTGQPAYSIPDSNPFNGDDVDEVKLHNLPAGSQSVTLAEIYAYGVRSPWRLTMDRGDAMGNNRGDLYLGDVGQNDFEEVTRLPAGEGGLNLGWPYREGKHIHTGPPNHMAPAGFTSLDPTFEFVHDDGDGFTVVGGFVYRGEAIPELQGKYVFADLGQDSGSGGQSPVPYARLYYGDPYGDGTFFSFDLSSSLERYNVVSQSGTPSLAPLPERIISIGEDLNGELYLVAIAVDPRQGGSQDARIIRLLDAPLFGDLNDDNMITTLDWTLFKAGQGADFTDLLPSESYYLGDLNGDLDHDLSDFWLFRTAYDDFNGAGAFAAEIGVPEPTGAVLAAILLLIVGASSRATRIVAGRTSCR